MSKIVQKQATNTPYTIQNCTTMIIIIALLISPKNLSVNTRTHAHTRTTRAHTHAHVHARQRTSVHPWFKMQHL